MRCPRTHNVFFLFFFPPLTPSLIKPAATHTRTHTTKEAGGKSSLGPADAVGTIRLMPFLPDDAPSPSQANKAKLHRRGGIPPNARCLPVPRAHASTGTGATYKLCNLSPAKGYCGLMDIGRTSQVAPFLCEGTCDKDADCVGYVIGGAGGNKGGPALYRASNWIAGL
jgi:hypothetical protein